MRSADIGAILGGLGGAAPGFMVGAEGIDLFTSGPESTEAWGLVVNGSLVALLGAAVGAVAGALAGITAGLVYRLVHNGNKRLLARVAMTSNGGYSMAPKAQHAREPAPVPVTATVTARKLGTRI